MPMNSIDVVAMLALLQYLAFSALVGRARRQFALKAPAVTGAEGFGFVLSFAPVLALVLAAFVPALLGKKSFDWDALARLHEKGYISNPVGQAKSVVFTQDGLRESERLLHQPFDA
jgi:hypothetical protein